MIFRPALAEKWAQHPYMIETRKRAEHCSPGIARARLMRAAQYLETHNGRRPNTEKERQQNRQDYCLMSGPPRWVRQLACKKAKLKLALSSEDEATLASWGGAEAVLRAAHDPRYEPARDILRSIGCTNLPLPEPTAPSGGSEAPKQGADHGAPQAEHRDQYGDGRN